MEITGVTPEYVLGRRTQRLGTERARSGLALKGRCIECCMMLTHERLTCTWPGEWKHAVIHGP